MQKSGTQTLNLSPWRVTWSIPYPFHCLPARLSNFKTTPAYKGDFSLFSYFTFAFTNQVFKLMDPNNKQTMRFPCLPELHPSVMFVKRKATRLHDWPRDHFCGKMSQPKEERWGAFHSTKNSGLKFRKFLVANGTVNTEIVQLVTPARLNRTIPFSFGQKFPEIFDRKVLQTDFFSNGTVISDQNGPTEKCGPPRKVDLFRKFSAWTEPFHSVWDRNFRKFWLNGSTSGH